MKDYKEEKYDFERQIDAVKKMKGKGFIFAMMAGEGIEGYMAGFIMKDINENILQMGKEEIIDAINDYFKIKIKKEVENEKHN